MLKFPRKIKKTGRFDHFDNSGVKETWYWQILEKSEKIGHCFLVFVKDDIRYNNLRICENTSAPHLWNFQQKLGRLILLTILVVLVLKDSISFSTNVSLSTPKLIHVKMSQYQLYYTDCNTNCTVLYYTMLTVLAVDPFLPRLYFYKNITHEFQ